MATAQQPTAPAASEAGKPTSKQPVAPASDQVEEAEPSVYYLEGEDGNLQPVIGLTFREFQELHKLKNRLAQRDQMPRYSIQSISAAGTAGEDYVQLTVHLQLLVREEDSVRVPLRLDQAVLTEPPQHEGSGEHVLLFEQDGEGYVSWIRGGSAGQHRLTLKMLVPLHRVGEETRLRLRAPRATTSELKLVVPLTGAVGKVSEGVTLLPPSATEDGATEFTVLGLGGDFELAWHKPGGRTIEAQGVLEAVVAQLSRVDGRSVNTEAKLTVRSHGAPLERFRVRLPKGADLLPGKSSGYTVATLKADDPASKDGQVVEVRLAKKTSDPIEIGLATRQTHDTAEPADLFELAGFEVLGAGRQWGHIAVAVVGDWHVLWGPGRGTRQIDELPEALQSEEVVAGFEYFAQPCSLTARVIQKRTRVSLEAEYVLQVDADRVGLAAKLKYTIRGAKVSTLEVAMSDWQLDDVGPENLVVVDAAAINESQVLSIPLAEASMGQIEVTISAHREIPAGTKSLKLSLPQPQVNSLGPSAVVVVPADNVELTPDVEATTGLIRQQVAAAIDLPERQQDKLFYRGESAQAVFAAGLRIHRRTIAVDVTTQVSLADTDGQVQQKLAYTIAYEPLDRLTIDVPRRLAESQRLKVQLDGKALSLVDPPVGNDRDKDNTPEMVSKLVLLPAPRIGRCELVIDYPLAPWKLQPKAAVARSVPLVMPAEGELSGNKLYVTSKAGIKVQHRGGGGWQEQENGSTRLSNHRPLQLSAAKRAGEVSLVLNAEDRQPTGSTVVTKAWVQTWLTHNVRQDRAVFRFWSNEKDVELIVPKGIAATDVELLLNGERLDGKHLNRQATSEGHIVIPLVNQGSNHRQHLLEAYCRFPNRVNGRGYLSIEIPRLARDVWVRRIYWQLVLPRDEHVVVAPEGLTREFTWGWSGFFWGRKPLLEQPQLETWTGASRQAAVGEGTNRYLFSNLGGIERCALRTSSRSLIVLGASGAALVVGLLLIYVPRSRHPGTLFSLAVLLLCTGFLYPEPTLLVSQAASLGLALALFAGLLERSVARRRREGMVRESSSSILEKGSTQTQHKPLAAGDPGSTETAPSTPPAPPDSNSRVQGPR